MSIIRNISRNVTIRKIVPYWLLEHLWRIVLKNKGEKLRKTLLKYITDKCTENQSINQSINQSTPLKCGEQLIISRIQKMDFIKMNF
jgi:hypothetical protein